ncbi:uncharacterized protein PgNI_00418 [Pyricularia grisea]|uniref:Uncharacterized protein n=1 Tax=Pyricularia grisea TaxID=148305 RepID=A0A6P8BMS4_PYRGI|nr:uncharacterized protein PgNI_00418 [Pyricularia grisea]TLD17845.1 hypothetical protein PgNI_00418 [Pyricularia grisea]
MRVANSHHTTEKFQEDGSFWDLQRCCYKKIVLSPRLEVWEWDGDGWETTLCWSEKKSDWVATPAVRHDHSSNDRVPFALAEDFRAGGRRAARAKAWLSDTYRRRYNLPPQDGAANAASASFSAEAQTRQDVEAARKAKDVTWRVWLLQKMNTQEAAGLAADPGAVARIPFPGDNPDLANGEFRGRRHRQGVNPESGPDGEGDVFGSIGDDELMLTDFSDEDLGDGANKQRDDLDLQNEFFGDSPPEIDYRTVLPAADDPEYLRIQQELAAAWSQADRRKWTTKAPVGVNTNDTETNHHFNGQSQPSVAERLQQLSNFLADEDVDRSRFWDKNIKEAREYLAAIRNIPMSKRTLKLLREVENKLKVHKDYEQWHARQAREPEVPTGDEAPPPVGSTASRAKISKGPRKVLHRMPGVVNTLPSRFKSSQAHIDALRDSQTTLWSTEGATDEEGSFLARAEQQHYDGAISSSGSWDHISNETDTAEAYAMERGSRRAVLEKCLRVLKNVENRAVHTLQERIVLPLTAAELEAERKSAAGPFFSSVGLTREDIERRIGQGGKQWHPHGMPYTKRMNRFWREWDAWWDEARKKTELDRHNAKSETDFDAHVNVKAGWAALPEPRSVYADVVTLQESYNRALEAMGTSIVKMLERTDLVAPRPLIKTCLKMYNLARDGEEPPPEEIQWRDVDRDHGTLRPLNVIELGYLRLLSTRSITPKMLCRLEDRGALYLAFAERLQRILDDLSEDNIFETRDTAVPVERLLEEMHKGVDGLNERTRFSVYDACNWLDRLQKQGRIRFNKSIKTYGYVQRPLAHVHPEYQIGYVPSRGDSRFQQPTNISIYKDFDAVLAPRPQDMVTWEQVVGSRSPPFWEDHEEVEWAESERARRQEHERSYPQEPQQKLLRPAVTNFFLALSYRLGFTLQKLGERKKRGKLTKQDMARSMADWIQTKTEWDRVLEASPDVAAKPATFVRVVAEIEMDKDKPAPQTEHEAVKLIRKKIIDEAEANLNNLYPTEFKKYLAKDGSHVTLPIRDEIWDWGAPEIRGRARQYFSLRRWPVHLQTAADQEVMTRDRDLDPEALWDPCAEDLTGPEWLLQKATPYQFETVKVKEGSNGYWFGDTKLQKEYIEAAVTNRFAEAVLGPQQPKKSILSRLSGFFPSASRPSTPVVEPPIPEDYIVPMQIDNQ